MHSLTSILAAALPLLDLALGNPALAPRQTPAATCVHDACSKSISETPHRPVCPAYLAAGPGNTPAPPTYTKLFGCDQDQIYSVCSCYFSTSTTATVASSTAVPTTTTTDAPIVTTTSAPVETTTAVPSPSSSTTTTALASSTSSQAAPSGSPCPYPIGANFTTPLGTLYELFCGYDVEYHTDPGLWADTIEECIDACAKKEFPGENPDTDPCLAITFNGRTLPSPSQVNCWLHALVEYGVSGTSVSLDSAIVLGGT
ncbi:hypothetical protein MMC10_005773 [Thelotrema lepadinum]|nr:hypothetical protein [Thelotrema lepadinum]